MDMVFQECRTMSDAEVVSRVCSGEPALYEILMRRYNQRLFRVIRSVIPNDMEAEDVLQEVWVHAYEHLDQFEGRAAFATWVTRIAFYAALGRARKSKRWAALESPEGDIMPEANRRRTTAETPETEAIRGEIGQMLQDAIDSLPEAYRAVFVLRQVEQLSTSETAECLDVTEETVKIRLHRSRAFLRRALEDRLGSTVTEAYAFMGTRCDRIVARVLARISRLKQDEMRVP
jgi:RNA polymerase sigma-70 factor (ECF subfamily)